MDTTLNEKRRFGFIIIDNEVLDDYLHRQAKDGKTPGPLGFALYAVLVRYANDGKCFPSLKTLANKTELSVKMVTILLRRLIDVGLISREQRRAEKGNFYSTEYAILDVKGCEPHTQPTTEEEQGLCTTFTRVMNDVHKGCVPRSHEQDIYNKTKVTRGVGTPTSTSKETVPVTQPTPPPPAKNAEGTGDRLQRNEYYPMLDQLCQQKLGKAPYSPVHIAPYQIDNADEALTRLAKAFDQARPGKDLAEYLAMKIFGKTEWFNHLRNSGTPLLSLITYMNYATDDLSREAQRNTPHGTAFSQSNESPVTSMPYRMYTPKKVVIPAHLLERKEAVNA